jgi:3-isopropylmalate/(R)-2-methylmalate dehydratase small subunit
VDLERQTLTAPDGTAHRFEVDPFRKQALLRGQDEIALTMEYEQAIAAHESRRAAELPWLT